MSARLPPDVLIITRKDITRLMALGDYLKAVEQAFHAAATGKASSPQPMHLPMTQGGFHAKGASLLLDRRYVAVKINGNFPGNPSELGLPTVQGAIYLADGSNGVPLAILDSTEVTLRRTAAASALAARLLARPDSSTLLVCGCGEQGRAHVAALKQVLPLQRYLLWDLDHTISEALAAELVDDAALDAVSVRDLKAASISADVIATCTPAREPFLELEFVSPGTFIAAVGADSPEKSEIAPRLMAAATVVTDVLDQCTAMGDLRHAIAAGLMSEGDVHAALSEVLAGAKSGRRSQEEIIILDSTGTGLQDVAAAAAIYERCSGNALVRSIALVEQGDVPC